MSPPAQPLSHPPTHSHTRTPTHSRARHHPYLSSFGYTDMLLNVRLKEEGFSYHIGELQLHLEGIHAIKPQTHRTYGVLRTVGWEDHEDDDAPNLGEDEDEDDGRLLSAGEVASRVIRRLTAVLPRTGSQARSRTSTNGANANHRSRGWSDSLAVRAFSSTVMMPRPSEDAPPSGSGSRSQASVIEMGNVGGGVVIENPILANMRRRSGGSGASESDTGASPRVCFHGDSAAGEDQDGAARTGAAQEPAAFDDMNLDDLGDSVVEVMEYGSDDDEVAIQPSRPLEGKVANEGHI